MTTTVTATRDNRADVLRQTETEVERRLIHAMKHDGAAPATPDLRIVIREAADVFTKDTALRWTYIARVARKVGITLDVHTADWSLTTFTHAALRDACSTSMKENR